MELERFFSSYDSGVGDKDQIFIVHAELYYGDREYNLYGSSASSREHAVWVAFVDFCKKLGLDEKKLSQVKVDGKLSNPLVTLDYGGKKVSGSAKANEDVSEKAYFEALISAISNVVPDKVTA